MTARRLATWVAVACLSGCGDSDDAAVGVYLRGDVNVSAVIARSDDARDKLADLGVVGLAAEPTVGGLRIESEARLSEADIDDVLRTLGVTAGVLCVLDIESGNALPPIEDVRSGCRT